MCVFLNLISTIKNILFKILVLVEFSNFSDYQVAFVVLSEINKAVCASLMIVELSEWSSHESITFSIFLTETKSFWYLTFCLQFD